MRFIFSRRNEFLLRELFQVVREQDLCDSGFRIFTKVAAGHETLGEISTRE
jgi:hypothetical protein